MTIDQGLLFMWASSSVRWLTLLRPYLNTFFSASQQTVVPTKKKGCPTKQYEAPNEYGYFLCLCYIYNQYSSFQSIRSLLCTGSGVQ